MKEKFDNKRKKGGRKGKIKKRKRKVVDFVAGKFTWPISL